MEIAQVTSEKIISVLEQIGKVSAYDSAVKYCFAFSRSPSTSNETIKNAYDELRLALSPLDDRDIHLLIEKLPIIQISHLRSEYDHLAPDGSEIYLLSRVTRGNMVYCVLPPGKITQAVKHNSIEELWYILAGKGMMWRMNEFTDASGVEHELVAGTSINIPTGTHFQFRNDGTEPLIILLVAMPPWPGNHEASEVENHWDV